MKRIIKYLLLVVFAFTTSILIYNHFQNVKVVDVDDDTLVLKEKKDSGVSVSIDYTFDKPNVILNPYGSSPLMALVTFRTKKLAAPKVTVQGKDGSNNLVHTFSPSKVHILPIYGLYPDYDNIITIEIEEEITKIHIKTDKLPDDFISTENSETSDSSIHFSTSLNDQYTVVYDNYGEVRFYINGSYKWD
ncbi:MAG: arylsulfate sulfotransferase N-terminal domain-containing protein [Bacilli bacterium]|nr:arylsulfate sulfotransferase N-terminal domain-containing protein [Bacilli bacterium]